jgi:ABC-type Fe3+/spermidine/putrescine transport system ATPase subunit
VRNQSGEEFLARFNGDRQIAVGEEVRLVVRPENIRIDSQDGLHGTVEDVVFSGAMAKVSIALADGSHLSVAVPAGNALPAKSARVALSWDADNAVIVA